MASRCKVSTDTRERGRLPGDALNYRQGSIDAFGRGLYTGSLIFARKRPPVEKHTQLWIPFEQIFGGIEHYVLAEIILLDGVFDLGWTKKRWTDHVFVDDEAAKALYQCTGECALPRSRQPHHEDQHWTRLA